MVLIIVVVVVILGAFAGGPVFFGDSTPCGCPSDPSGARDQNVSHIGCSKCDLEEIEATMRAKKLPKELKVEMEGELYSVPDNVEFLTPTFKAATKCWKTVLRKGRGLSEHEDDADMTVKDKLSSCDPSTRGELAAVTDSCPGEGGAKHAAEKDVRLSGDHSCQICFEDDRSTAMLPCGHGGLCWDCGLQIYALTEECPMCRTKIELLVPLDGKKRRREGDDEFVSSATYGKDGKPLVA